MSDRLTEEEEIQEGAPNGWRMKEERKAVLENRKRSFPIILPLAPKPLQSHR
jgi:hypothetical protein